MKVALFTLLLLTPFVLGDVAGDVSSTVANANVQVPDVQVPSIQVPSASADVNGNTVSTPSVDISSLSAPSLPQIDASSLPSVPSVPSSYSSAGASQGQVSGTVSSMGASADGSAVSAQNGHVDFVGDALNAAGANTISTGPVTINDGQGNSWTGSFVGNHDGKIQGDQNGGSAAGAIQIVGSGSGSDGSSIDGVFATNGDSSLSGNGLTFNGVSTSTGASGVGSAISSALNSAQGAVNSGTAAGQDAVNQNGDAVAAVAAPVISQAQGVLGSSGVSLPSSISGQFNNQTVTASTDGGLSVSVSSAAGKAGSLGVVAAIAFGLLIA